MPIDPSLVTHFVYHIPDQPNQSTEILLINRLRRLFPHKTTMIFLNTSFRTVILLWWALDAAHAFVTTTQNRRQSLVSLQAHTTVHRRQLLQTAVASVLFTTPLSAQAATFGNDDANLFRPIQEGTSTAPSVENKDFHAEMAIAVVPENSDDELEEDDDEAQRKAQEEWLGAYGALF